MGVRTILAGALAALALGCGSGGGGSDADAGPDDVADGGADPSSLDCARKSGSRIRQVERLHSDDSDELLRLYDTELAVPCAFGASDDGSLRCLPVADGAPFAAGRIYYEDADCNSRIARLDDALGADPPDYMRQAYATNDGCEVRTRYAVLGNQLLVPADATVYDGACVPVVAGTNPYFQITSDLGPADLVEGTATWTDSGRIKQQQIDGDDGSRVCGLAMIDEELESHPCALQVAEDGATRCLPASSSVDEAFADDACSEPVVFAILDETCAPPNRFTVESTGGECPKVRVRALLEELDVVYAMGDACDAVVLEENQTVFEQGPAVSGTSFSGFEPAYAAPGDRLERVDLDNGAGLRVATTFWRDPEMQDAWCTFRTAEDGLARCLPVNNDQSPVAGVATRFSEGTCNTAVKVGVADTTCGRAAAKYATEVVEEETLVYPSMEPYEAGTLFEGAPDACAAVADPSQFTQLGAPIDAAAFVSGTEMIE